MGMEGLYMRFSHITAPVMLTSFLAKTPAPSQPLPNCPSFPSFSLPDSVVECGMYPYWNLCAHDRNHRQHGSCSFEQQPYHLRKRQLCRGSKRTGPEWLHLCVPAKLSSTTPGANITITLSIDYITKISVTQSEFATTSQIHVCLLLMPFSFSILLPCIAAILLIFPCLRKIHPFYVSTWYTLFSPANFGHHTFMLFIFSHKCAFWVRLILVIAARGAAVISVYTVLSLRVPFFLLKTETFPCNQFLSLLLSSVSSVQLYVSSVSTFMHFRDMLAQSFLHCSNFPLLTFGWVVMSVQTASYNLLPDTLIEIPSHLFSISLDCTRANCFLPYARYNLLRFFLTHPRFKCLAKWGDTRCCSNTLGSASSTFLLDLINFIFILSKVWKKVSTSSFEWR